MDLLQATVNVHNPDIVGITESWANKKILDAELWLEGYDMFRQDRPGNKIGGGVLLYVRNSLEAIEYKMSTNFPEQIWCRLKVGKNSQLLLGVCYRTPNDNIYGHGNHELIRNLIREVSNHQFLLMGDFNYPGIYWSDDCVESQVSASAEAKLFEECIDDNFVTQHVKEVTRNEAILDLVITKEPEIVSSLTVIEKFAESDHNMLQCTIEVDVEDKTTNTYSRNYNKANYKGMKEKLRQADWKGLIEGETMEEAWRIFRQIMEDIEEEFVPMRNTKGSGRKKPLWLSYAAIKKVNRKHRIYRKYRLNDHPACIAASKEASKAVKKAKMNFEQKLAENIKTDNKSFFAYVRSKSRTRVRPGPITDDSGVVLDSPQEMAEEFNKFFASVFTQENLNNIPRAEQVFNGPPEEQLMDMVITKGMIRSKLDKMRSDKAPGEDGITSRMVRELREELIDPLHILFTKSLGTGVVPEDWRKANVTPIYKKGGRGQVGNYRPVSLTSQISKIMESLIRDHIVRFLESNNLIRNSQHGFRTGRSCLSNLLVFMDKVTAAVEKCENVDVIYLDFAKAFDKVPHRRLMEKLKSHGIGGKIGSWIEAWLLGRQQRVCLQGKASDWTAVTSSVPQGSVLGPLLFIIFINDLDSGIINSILKFADDTKVFGSINDMEDRDALQRDLDRMMEWAKVWQMEFNVDKCKVMHLGRDNIKYKYIMDGKELTTTDLEKDLGINLTKNLKTSYQCLQAYNKASQMLGLLGRTIKSRNPDILIKIYKGIVRPHLEFCSPVWAPHYRKDKELLEKVQHRFTRMFPHLRNLEYKKRLEILGLWTLEERRNRADLIEMFKIVKGKSGIKLEAMFEIDQNSGTRGHSYKVKKKFSKGNTRHYFFSERIVSRWNRLSQEAVDASSVNVFKGQLTKMRRTRMGFFMDDQVC